MFIRALLSSTALRAPEDDLGGGHYEGTEVGDEGDGYGYEEDALDGEQDPADPDPNLEPEEGEQAAAAQTPRQPTRFERQMAETRRRAQEAEDRAAAAERRIQEAEARQRQAAEDERLRYMDPEERDRHRAQVDQQRQQHEMNVLRFEIADGKDQTAFSQFCSTRPHMAALAQDVEAELKRLRSTGVNVGREALAYHLLGKKADERAARAKPKAERQAQQSRERQAARPTGSRSDTSGGSRSGNDRQARAKRLENEII